MVEAACGHSWPWNALTDGRSGSDMQRLADSSDYDAWGFTSRLLEARKNALEMTAKRSTALSTVGPRTTGARRDLPNRVRGGVEHACAGSVRQPPSGSCRQYIKDSVC